MAEAFAKIYGRDNIDAYSAGSSPSGKINSKAIDTMSELGYDLSKHHSKSLEEVKRFSPFDAVITMGCGDACPWMPAKQFIEWDIPDPKEMSEEDLRKVREQIKKSVKNLLSNI